jgi:hypothetical protein
MSDQTLGEKVREIEQDFISGTGTLMSEHVRTDLYNDINQIYAYLASKHISGEYDSMGREKPFFNIVLAARNVWFRATDIDRKNIRAKAAKSSDIIGAFLLSVHLDNWMKKVNFGKFLNAWGLELASFNSQVVKFVEKDGELIPKVVPWSQLIVDQINFDDNMKIEILELTEEQMYSRGYDKDVIEGLSDAEKARETTGKQKKDNKNNYFKVYEVHGKLPLSYLTGEDKDDDEYVQQMHVISFVVKKDGRKKEYEEFTLYSGREEKDPYMLTSLIPATDGSISLDGAVKNLFQAQWMLNHSKKAIKDQLDLASKLVFQTADGSFLNQNALTAIENGDILIHDVNKPITQLQNNSHDVTSLQSFGAEWKQLASEINGISESMLGNTAPSGTAWRQVEALLQESHSLFEIMTENKGLAIEDMCRKFIFPYLKKKMNTAKEISATLEMNGITQIEDRYIRNKAILKQQKQARDFLLADGAEPDSIEAEMAKMKAELQATGDQRFFKPSELSDATWKEVLEDLEWEAEVETTGENSDKQSMLTTLNTALNLVMNPNFANNPKAQFIFDKILTETGKVTTMELNSLPNPQPQIPTTPNGGQVDVGELQGNMK